MFSGFTPSIRQLLRKANFGMQRRLFRALLISFVAHYLVFLVLGPSIGVSMSLSVRQLPIQLNIVVSSSANMGERGAFDFAPSTFASEASGKTSGGRRLVQPGLDAAGMDGPAGSLKSQQELDVVSKELSETGSNNNRAINLPDRSYGLGLNRPPQLLSDVSIVYPEAAGGRQGIVQLRISVNEQGRIIDMAVLTAEPKGLFEEAALSAFSGAKFNPGEVLGQPVVSDYIVEIDFLPINRDNASGRGY